jgi:uncharacterized protein
VVLGGSAAAVLLLIWSVAIEPRVITEEEFDVDIPDLPPSWEGQRLALIADPQVGPWFSNTGTLRRIVRRLVKLRPAAVLIAGDFIYDPLLEEPEERAEFRSRRAAAIRKARRAAAILQPLAAAAIPAYAVLGNHDLDSALPARPNMLQQLLEGAGVRVLVNEAVPMRCSAGDGELWLVGLAAEARRARDSRAAFDELPHRAARVVLMHNPDSFEQLPAGSAPLALAGHTHGGQVLFPYQVVRRLLGWVNKRRPQLAGWIRDYGQPGNRLYINRGIGFSHLPLRFNAPPEITVFTLRRAARAG